VNAHTTKLPKGVAVSMVAAPLLLLVAELSSPVSDATDTPATRLEGILDHPGRYTVTVLALVSGLLLMVPAVAGLRRHVLHAGEPDDKGGVATSLAIAGFMLFAVASGALGVGPSAWPGVERGHEAVLVEAFEAMDDGRGAMPIAQWGPLLSVVGMTVLSVVLWRDHRYPRWAAVALGVGWFAFLLTPVHTTRALGLILLLLGFAPAMRPRVEALRTRAKGVPARGGTLA